MNINWLNAELEITNCTKLQLNIIDMPNELQMIFSNFLSYIDFDDYYEFTDIETGLLIDPSCGEFNDFTLTHIEIQKIIIDNNLIELALSMQANVEIIFPLDVIAYDGWDKEYFKVASRCKSHQETIQIRGQAKKDVSNDEPLKFVPNQRIGIKLKSEILGSEIFDVTDQEILNLISDTKFCPFALFERNIGFVKQELLHLSDASNSFARGVMLYTYSMAIFENYLLIRLCRLILNNPKFSCKLQEKIDDPNSIFKHMKKVEDLRYKNFHNHKFLLPLLREVCGIDFNHHKIWLSDAVDRRNHCVHRAGLDHEENQIEMNVDILRKVTTHMNELANELESRLACMIYKNPNH